LLSDINVSQGSVATYARSGGIFNNHFTANLPRNLLVKNSKSIKILFDRIMTMSLWPASFLAHPVVVCLVATSEHFQSQHSLENFLRIFAKPKLLLYI